MQRLIPFGNTYFEWRRSDNSDAAVYLNTGWGT